jgi:hypothetical protein
MIGSLCDCMTSLFKGSKPTPYAEVGHQ